MTIVGRWTGPGPPNRTPPRKFLRAPIFRTPRRPALDDIGGPPYARFYAHQFRNPSLAAPDEQKKTPDAKSHPQRKLADS